MATVTALETDPRSKSVRPMSYQVVGATPDQALAWTILAYDPFQWLFTTSTYKEVMGK